MEITSPPWPSEAVNLKRFYQILIDYRDWLEQAGHSSNAETDAPPLPAPGPVPPYGAFEALPVAQHAHNFQIVRAVRTGWDILVREHEDSWGSALACARRQQLLGIAGREFAEFFVPYEAREAKAAEQAARQQSFAELARRIVLLPFGQLLGGDHGPPGAEDG